MNLAQFRARTRLQLGNLPEAHPIMANLDDWINDAIRDLPQIEVPGFDHRALFTELTRKTLIQPVGLQAWINTPFNFLSPINMFVFYSEDQPDPDFAQAHPVTRVDKMTYEVMNKDERNGNGDWARTWSWFDDRIYLWPTPVAGSLGWLYLYYFYEQPDLTVDEQVPLLNKRWHRAACSLATAYGEHAQHHPTRAKYFEDEAKKQLMQALNWVGRSDQYDPQVVKVYGDPDSSEIYD